MDAITAIAEALLLEQDTKLSVLRRAIGERLPVTIYYSGPPDEVRAGQRMDIEPIVMGDNAKSGNLVIWAYVFKGVSKRGLPGWKMFRVDRIESAVINDGAERFKLGDLPGYVKGKAPSMMKSLSDVKIFSPYWFGDDEEEYTPTPPPGAEDVPREPEAVPTEPAEPEQPESHPSSLARRVFSDLGVNVQDVNGERIISKNDYDTALDNLYGYQKDQFVNRQRTLGNNERPGEGTRDRFRNTSKFELDRLLAKDNIKVDNGPELEPPEEVENDNNMLAEAHRIQSRVKRLIKW
jgi:hypothetical protein